MSTVTGLQVEALAQRVAALERIATRQQVQQRPARVKTRRLQR